MHKENGIEIELTAAELQSLDITYEKLDYANIETRRVLWTVLDEALGTLGREMDLSGRMLIEAQPVGDGGCILDFTVLPDTVTNPSSISRLASVRLLAKPFAVR